MILEVHNYRSFVYFVTEDNVGILNHRLRNRSNPCILILERKFFICFLKLNRFLKNLNLEEVISFFLSLRPALDVLCLVSIQKLGNK